MWKRINWNTERILGISAMSVSVFTLIIFMYQTNLIRKQNYISILPYLSFSTSDSSVDDSYKVSIENYGVGPAIIEQVILKNSNEVYDLKNYGNDMFLFLASAVPELDSITNFSHSTLEPGMAIPANSAYNFVEIKNDPEGYELFKHTLEKLLENGLYFEVKYKSIQNEHWLLSNIGEGPERID